MNEWTVLDDGYIQCGERKFYVGSNISGEIVSTHNAALAAERELLVRAFCGVIELALEAEQGIT